MIAIASRAFFVRPLASTHVLALKRWSSATTSASTSSPLVLYQYAICPFCHQAKAFLDYYQTPYQAIEVNPLTKAELQPFTKYKQVPIAVVPGDDPLFGSDLIMDHITKEVEGNTKKNNDVWTKFAREELAVLLYPNLCRTLGSSYDAFRYVHDVPSFTWMQRVSVQMVGSLAMYMAASRVKKKHNIVDEQASLDTAMDKLESALTDPAAAYLSSTSTHPGSGDLTVFGTLRSLAVASPSLLKKIISPRPAVVSWYERMEAQVQRGKEKE